MQLTALSYHHADASTSYSVTITDCQFFQMHASVNTNTMITLPHSHTATCTSCSRQTTTFRHVNMLTYCTFLQFLSSLHHPDWSILAGPTTVWKTWKVDEEMWIMLGESNYDPQLDAKMSVHAVTRSPPATLCLSYANNRLSPVPEVCNTSVTWRVSKLRMTA